MLVGITGGTGFIGKTLVQRHIAAGDTVRLLSRHSGNTIKSHKVHVFHADLAGPVEFLIPFVDGVDVLYHCAGEIKDHMEMYSVNVKGTQNLCLAADHRIGHWVMLSSVGVYGPHHSGIVTEKTPLNPMGTYEKTKTEADKIITNAARANAFTFSILRPSNVFGPSMANQSLFQVIKMINKRLFFFIGKPYPSANYIHVDNVVDGLMRCAKNPAAKGCVYNISDHRTLEQLVKLIAKVLKRPVPTLRLPEFPVRFIARVLGRIKGFPLTESRVDALTNHAVYPINKIATELGYTHMTSMEKGIAQLVTAWQSLQDDN